MVLGDSMNHPAVLSPNARADREVTLRSFIPLTDGQAEAHKRIVQSHIASKCKSRTQSQTFIMLSLVPMP